MTASSQELWRRQFENWSTALPRGGILVTDFDQINFADFRITDDFLYVERVNPDALGARNLLILFSDVRGVKFTKPLDIEVFEKAGFRKSGPSPNRRAADAQNAPPVGAAPRPQAAVRPAPARPAPPVAAPANPTTAAPPSVAR